MESKEKKKKGLENLEKHIENIQDFNIEPVVAINKFITDTDEEIEAVKKRVEELGVEVSVAEVWAKGGAGAEDLAKKVAKAAESNTTKFKPTYCRKDSITDKIEAVAKSIYGADGVNFSAQAKKDLKSIEKLGLSNLPICVAKTQKSFTDNQAIIGRPTGFKITVREIEIASGAGFVVPITGAMMRMPGLPATPASENIDIDSEGNITGLF